MAERQLSQIIHQLKTQSLNYPEAASLLSKAKRLLLQLDAATPFGAGATANPQLLAAAREIYEQGALYSIRDKNPDAFLRYVTQLGPFYEQAQTQPATQQGGDAAAAAAAVVQQNKVTGLYLLLLLTQGRYAEFHSELETLASRQPDSDVERDNYLGYPIRLERWLMEGSYDRVWKAMKKGEVPCEEYGVFSEILTSQIRSEIASSSERAYPSLPLSSTKSLLFLDSEGAVVEFAQERGWIVRDGQIYFPASVAAVAGAPHTAEGDTEEGAAAAAALEEDKEFSRTIIENTLGYARQLETIV